MLTGRVILPGFILEGVCLLTQPWERSLALEKCFFYSLFIVHPSWSGSLPFSVGDFEETKSAFRGCTQTAGSLSKSWLEREVLESPFLPVKAAGSSPVRTCVSLGCAC